MHEGWGHGSCWINATLQFLFSATAVRDVLAAVLSEIGTSRALADDASMRVESKIPWVVEMKGPRKGGLKNTDGATPGGDAA